MKFQVQCMRRKTIAELVQHCSEYIFNNFQYIKGITDIETTADEILNLKSGVCQILPI